MTTADLIKELEWWLDGMRSAGLVPDAHPLPMVIERLKCLQTVVEAAQFLNRKLQRKLHEDMTGRELALNRALAALETPT